MKRMFKIRDKVQYFTILCYNELLLHLTHCRSLSIQQTKIPTKYDILKDICIYLISPIGKKRMAKSIPVGG